MNLPFEFQLKVYSSLNCDNEIAKSYEFLLNQKWVIASKKNLWK